MIDSPKQTTITEDIGSTNEEAVEPKRSTNMITGKKDQARKNWSARNIKQERKKKESPISWHLRSERKRRKKKL